MDKVKDVTEMTMEELEREIFTPKFKSQKGLIQVRNSIKNRSHLKQYLTQFKELHK